jgi:hypothetical protein
VRVSDFPEVIIVEASNSGESRVIVIGVWWQVRYPRLFRWLAPKGGYHTNPPELHRRSHKEWPAILEPAQTLQWQLDLDVAAEMAERLLAPSWLWRLHLRFFRVGVSTSVGVSVVGKLGSALKQGMRARVEAKRAGLPPPQPRRAAGGI